MALYNFSSLPGLGKLFHEMSSFVKGLDPHQAVCQCDQTIKQYMAEILMQPLYAHHDCMYFMELNNYLCTIFHYLRFQHSLGVDPVNPFNGNHGPVATGTNVGHAAVVEPVAAPAVAVPGAAQRFFVNHGLVQNQSR